MKLKIDERLFRKIVCLEKDFKARCFVYYNDKPKLLKFLKAQKIPIKSEYMFIDALYLEATKEEIFSLAKLPNVIYISSLTVASSQMKVARDILKVNRFNLLGAV